MDRCWFFTWRTYGTWLPGEEGFVGEYCTTSGVRRIDNAPGTETAAPMPALSKFAGEIMTEPPVYLTQAQAEAVFKQMQETASIRKWRIDAIAVLATHVHVVFAVPGDPNPSDLLRDWKSYASRALNRLEHRKRWWVDGGSKRPIKTPEKWIGEIGYVRDQKGPLVLWLSEEARKAAGPPTSGEPVA